MGFDVTADAYGRFMGRFSEPLAVPFADRLGVASGQRALDVGCGPGALTAVLVDRLGADQVQAIDPSVSFVAALHERLPDVEVRTGTAESLPFDDDFFDLVLAQLVVHFMKDPVGGLGEMARVTKPGGVVAATVWDYARGAGPVTKFWSVVRKVDPEHPGELDLPGMREGHLAQLFRDAGLDPEESTLEVEARFTSFDDWWEPYTMGVGPAGDYVTQLDDADRERLRQACAHALPDGPFTLPARAFCVSARV